MLSLINELFIPQWRRRWIFHHSIGVCQRARIQFKNAKCLFRCWEWRVNAPWRRGNKPESRVVIRMARHDDQPMPQGCRPDSFRFRRVSSPPGAADETARRPGVPRPELVSAAACSQFQPSETECARQRLHQRFLPATSADQTTPVVEAPPPVGLRCPARTPLNELEIQSQNHRLVPDEREHPGLPVPTQARSAATRSSYVSRRRMSFHVAPSTRTSAARGRELY